jgi:hypothetical protein
MKIPNLLSVLLCVLLLAAILSPQPVSAAVLPLSGGTLTVNTSGDASTVGDNVLSLREAMNIANGSLLGPFSLAERLQMSGCTFDASGNITSGCGAGGDTIRFDPSMTQVLLSSRPPLINKDNVTIDGSVSAGNTIINGQGLADYGFNIAANNVVLHNLTVIKISGYGAAVGLGNGSWKGLQVYNNYLGVLPGTTSCSDPQIANGPYFTVILFGGSGISGSGNGTAYIYNNVIGCSQNDGIAISNAPYVYVGQTPSGQISGNWIGVTRGGGNIGNGSGVTVCCSTGAVGNEIIGNKVGYSSGDGIRLQLVSANIVNSNDIFHNKGAGIHILDTSLTTLNDNTSHDNDGSGIWLDQTTASPSVTFQNAIRRGAYYHNGAAGITEGNGSSQNSWEQISTYANLGLGIDKNDNGQVDPPPLTLTGTAQTGQGLVVNGTLGGTIFLSTIYHIELYSISPDPTGYGEGYHYIGSTDLTWNMSNNYSWSIPNPSGLGCYTATLTVIDAIIQANSSSSEFSKNLGTQCNLTYIPVVQR